MTVGKFDYRRAGSSRAHAIKQTQMQTYRSGPAGKLALKPDVLYVARCRDDVNPPQYGDILTVGKTCFDGSASVSSIFGCLQREHPVFLPSFEDGEEEEANPFYRIPDRMKCARYGPDHDLPISQEVATGVRKCQEVITAPREGVLMSACGLEVL
ncbi:hypothetical protein Bbelb_203650 [Branchiostoma belcheri]|nr:hypothetical protein Bbelb_203650 [Branchiostoma belcheri]